MALIERTALHADTDTIAAIATASGFAGVGIVRVSGPKARPIGERLTGGQLKDRRVQFRRLLDSTGETIDSGLVLYFEGPRSFTGEDVVEFQGHGGPVVLSMLLDAVLAAGARLARPGEFTERAYLHGKMDLTQAEAVADLISGSSEAAVRGANRSLSGEFSRRVRQIDQQVVDLRVFVEAAIDFPDEDIDLLAQGQVTERLDGIGTALAKLVADCGQGVKLTDGLRLAIIGPPNAGKSSLLNRLAGESLAIVTDIPGTTRDLIRADLVLEGLPVHIVDTAGLRKTADEVEAEGVRRALGEAGVADLVLLMAAVDGNGSWTGDDARLLRAQAPEISEDRLLRVLNKADLAADPEVLRERAQRKGWLPVSALTGWGLEGLREEIRRRAGFVPGSALFTARRRHLEALERALTAARSARALADDGLPGELIAEELKTVHAAFGEIVGEMTSDALLGEIFSRFCIGK